MADERNSSTTSRRGFWLAAALYGALIVYGSLFPLSGWRSPQAPLFSFLFSPLPSHISRADLITNLLAYAPLGLFLAGAMDSARRWRAVAFATLAGFLLSLSMETLQMYLPSRDASNIDLAANVVSTFAGTVLAAIVAGNIRVRAVLRELRFRWLIADGSADVALWAMLLWAASQLSPFVPSMDVSSVRHGLSPLWYTLHGSRAVFPYQLAAYALNISGLGLLLGANARSKFTGVSLLVGAAGVVLCAKPLIVGRQLSFEAACGYAIAIAVVVFTPHRPRLQAMGAALCIVAGFAAAELAPAAGPLSRFNWIPLLGQIDNTLNGFEAILEGVWPFAALAAVCLQQNRHRARLLWGVIGAAALTGTLEWNQQRIPGRHGDITPVLLACCAWTMAYLCGTYAVRSDGPALPATACPVSAPADLVSER